MKKLLLVNILFTLLFVANVHGEEQTFSDFRTTSDVETTSDAKQEKIKFGIHARISRGYAYFDTYLRNIANVKIGAFGEYKIHEALGLQTALYWSRLSHTPAFKNALGSKPVGKPDLERDYLSIPAILRFYPGKDRQFCMFYGFEISLLTRMIGAAYTSSNPKRGNDLGLESQFILGIDYEIFGIQLGVEGNIKLTDSLKFNDVLLNRANHIGIALGYNFGKLL